MPTKIIHVSVNRGESARHKIKKPELLVQIFLRAICKAVAICFRSGAQFADLNSNRLYG